MRRQLEDSMKDNTDMRRQLEDSMKDNTDMRRQLEDSMKDNTDMRRQIEHLKEEKRDMSEQMEEFYGDLELLIKRPELIARRLKAEPAALGWHNPHLPPALRRACLKGKRAESMMSEADGASLTYYLAACWYERFCGCKAPCDFRVYRSWRRKLLSAGDLTEKERRQALTWIEHMLRASMRQ